MQELFNLFPIPVMRVRSVLGVPLVNSLISYFSTITVHQNNTSPSLTHTELLEPSQSPLFMETAALITPQIVTFGNELFGERIGWSIKEMWVNFLDHGGHQAMHNHANSFISGVVYLTPTDPSSQTVFMKSPGGHDYTFKNDHKGTVPNQYNADKWISPAPAPGDMILFPSYLMHAVPPNQGERRISMAFNAIPVRLNSWGYLIGFSG